jgi:hypothetical protein
MVHNTALLKIETMSQLALGLGGASMRRGCS